MPDRARRGRSLVSGAAAIAAVLALAGCTVAPAAPHLGATASPTPTSAVLPPVIPNDPGLRSDASMTSCSSAKGGWRASGQIANSTGDARDYRLTVLFTSSKATVIGSGTATVHVRAGQKVPWSIRADFVPASPTLCVLSGVA
ncbi:MAG TPA: hypothetical protein VGM70_02930 [Pseudolysinimonas sp.]|jgi:hypothetical protein